MGITCPRAFLGGKPFHQRDWRDNGTAETNQELESASLCRMPGERGNSSPVILCLSCGRPCGAWRTWAKPPDERGKVRGRWAARPGGHLPSITAENKVGLRNYTGRGFSGGCSLRVGSQPWGRAHRGSGENLLELSCVHVLPLLTNCSEASPGLRPRLEPSLAILALSSFCK